jgi:hypothetical protein
MMITRNPFAVSRQKRRCVTAPGDKSHRLSETVRFDAYLIGTVNFAGNVTPFGELLRWNFGKKSKSQYGGNTL